MALEIRIRTLLLKLQNHFADAQHFVSKFILDIEEETRIPGNTEKCGTEEDFRAYRLFLR